MDEIQILEKLKLLIASKIGVSSNKIHLHSKLEDDLGLTGEDANEFFIFFSTEFGVDISNFKINNYFNDEGLDFISAIVNVFKEKKENLKKTLTVDDLIKAIKIGRLE